MASGVTPNYSIPYPVQTDPVDVAGDVEQLATRIDTYINEWIQDVAATMIINGSYTNGINTPVYNDTAATISISLSQDLQVTASPTFVNLNLTGSILTPSVIDVTSSTDALRITQKGSGNALLVEDSTNTDSSPFLINSDGQIVSGITTAFNGYNTSLQLVGTDSLVDGGINTRRISDSYIGQSVFIEKARGTIASPQIVDDNDEIGKIVFNAFDGTSWVPAAEISSIVNGVPGTGDMPGAIVFSTTPDNFSFPFERMRITNNGYVGINTINPSAELEVSGQIIADGGLFNSLVSSTSNITNIFATSIDATNIITSSPTSSNDVATKAYVDGLSGSLAQEVIMFDDISSDFDGQTNRFFLTNNLNTTKIYSRMNMVVDPSFEGTTINDSISSYLPTTKWTVRTNLIRNPSLKFADEYQLLGSFWDTYWPDGGAVPSYLFPSYTPLFGDSCLAIKGNGTSKGFLRTYLGPQKVVEPNTTYTMSVYVKDISTSGISVRLGHLFTGTYQYSSSQQLTSDWKRISWTFTTPAVLSSQRFLIETVSNLALDAVFLVDGFLLEKGSNLLPYFDGDDSSQLTDKKILLRRFEGSDKYNSTSTIIYSTAPEGVSDRWSSKSIIAPSNATLLIRENLIPNPSFENIMTNWSVYQGPLTLSISDQVSLFGKYSLKCSTLNESGNLAIITNNIAIEPNQSYTASIYVNSEDTMPGASMSLLFYDISNTYLSGTGILANGLDQKLEKNTWDRFSVGGTSPANAAYAQVVVWFNPVRKWSYIYLDGALLEKGYFADEFAYSNKAIANDYFDGNNFNGDSEFYSLSWNGIVNNSSSKLVYYDPSTQFFCNSSVMSRSYSEKYIGNCSVKIETDGSVINQGANYFLGSLLANTTYTISAYIKPQSGRPISMTFYDRGNNVYSSSSETTGTTWQRLTVTMTTGALPTTGLIIFRTDATLGASVFYIDAVMCEQTDQLFDYFDGDNAPISAGRIIQKPAWQLNKNNSISTIEYCDPGEFKPTNPNRLQLSINGIIQTVSYPEYVWQSMFPQDGFTVDSDGYVTFSEAPVRGSKFTGRYINGNTTVAETNKRRYPFRPIDLLLGS